ncbi:MAG: transposase, partial [Phycisphaeraceae bacterium]
CYHVINRGVGRMQLFDDEADYLAFVRVLGEGLSKYPDARLLSYCVMPNHWHLVFWPRRGSDRVLSELMRWVGTTHVRRWHEHRHTAGTGPIYQGRFKSFPIQADEHLLTACRYVERNALRAGLVAKAEDWRWGSLWLRRQGARQRVQSPERHGDSPLEANLLTEEELVLKGLLDDGPVGRPRNWVSLVNKPQSQAEVEALAVSIAKGRPYGASGWVNRTAGKQGISLRGRGRPGKKRG